MEDDEDDEGPFEVFGIHRLELAPGTKSGDVGVRPNPSKKRPWQAWLQVGRRSATLRSLRMPRWPGSSGKGLWFSWSSQPAKAGSAQ